MNEPGIYTLEKKIRVTRPRGEVFAFFSKAENLNELTPPDLKFQILTPKPIAMDVGTLIDYQIRLLGLPMGWRTRITRWEPPVCFADIQESGPYALWDHLHEFLEDGQGTLIRDFVRFRPRGGPLAPLAHVLFVRRQLEKIFDYRARKIRELFP